MKKAMASGGRHRPKGLHILFEDKDILGGTKLPVC